MASTVGDDAVEAITDALNTYGCTPSILASMQSAQPSIEADIAAPSPTQSGKVDANGFRGVKASLNEVHSQRKQQQHDLSSSTTSPSRATAMT
jgi:hypothetical protein